MPNYMTYPQALELYEKIDENKQDTLIAGSGISIASDGKTISATGGGGGTSDYSDLENKPQINGVTLSGDKSTGDLIPLGDGIKYDPVTLKLSADLLQGSNISLEPQASGAIKISAAGGGGGGGSYTASKGVVISGSDIEADLKGYTPGSEAAASYGSSANRTYAVGLDSNSKLAVNIPLSVVALSGSYGDLSGKPSIPTVTDTYSGTSSDAMSGKAVKSAIDGISFPVSNAYKTIKVTSGGSSSTVTASGEDQIELDAGSNVTLSASGKKITIASSGGGGGAAAWGSITGTLSNQTDLQGALDAKYDTSDTAETTIDDADYFPFYDSSATAKRKSLWSNIKSLLADAFKPISTKNLIWSTIDDLKMRNTYGTWNGRTYSMAGLSFACSMNSLTDTIDYIYVSGTNGSSQTYIEMNVYLDVGKYILSGCTGGSGITYGLHLDGGGGLVVNCYDGDVEFTVSSPTTCTLKVIFWSTGLVVSGKYFYPMIRPAIYKDNTFVRSVFSNATLTKKIPKWTGKATVSAGTITFDNVYDDDSSAFDVYINVSSSSTNKCPYAKLTTISGSQHSRTFVYETDADNGAAAYLLRTPVAY